jgi:hypothetical protein
MTYEEIFHDILRTLDYPVEETAGDIPLLVLSKMRDISREIIADYKDKSLLKKSAVFTIDSSTTTVPVGASGFEVTDMVFPWGITIDSDDLNDETSDKFLGYMSYEAWTNLNSFKTGNNRPSMCFTINLDDEVEFSTKPSGDQEWEARLWYYRELGEIVLSETPALPQYYHSLITLGVVLEFPQLFKSGERLVLYRRLEDRFDNLRRKLNGAKGIGKHFFNIRKRGRSNVNGTFWPRGRL